MSIEAQPEAAPTEPLQPRASAGLIVAITFASLGLWIATLTPVISTLQLKVSSLDSEPTSKAVTLSLVLGIGALLGLIVNPLAGRLSDRTTWRLGMRRPWLLIGALISLAGVTTAGLAPSLGLVVVGWCLAQIGNNTVMAVLFALLPDHIPVQKRGLVGALIGISQALAAVIGGGIAFALASTIALTLIVPGVLALVLIAVLCLVVKDRRLDPADRLPFSGRDLLRTYWVSPRRFPDFGWAWVSRFAIFMTISTALNYQVFFLTAQLGLSSNDALGLVPLGLAIQTPGLIITSILCGALSDRFKRRRIFVVIASFVAALGLVVLAFAPSIPFYLLSMVLIGIGQGVYFAVDVALVTDVLPNKQLDAAKNFGVINLANLLPQSIAPAIAPAFLAIPLLSMTGTSGQNYTALFLVGAIFAVLAGVAISRVKGVR